MTLNSLPAWFEQLRRGGRIVTTADAYSVSPLLYRATNLRADALSSIPYRLTYNDVEQDWPFVQSFPQLLKDIERSLCLTGGAYLYKIYKGRRLMGFVPLNPTTMNVTLMTDKATLENPLLGASFVQSINGKSYGPWTVNEVVYFREPSYLDDIGPGIAPAHVALSNAKLEHYLSRFASAFFEGGAQPVTIMNLPEHMDEAEFQRFRTEMRSTIGGGIINAFKMIFMRAPDIKIEQLTPPLNSLQMPELYERVITSVGMAYGVPRTMLEASAANYATAESDRQSFWRETIIPRLSLYEAVLNTQIFAPLGWKISFQPEMLDVMQVDEASRAGSLLQLVQAGVPLRGAMTILGYDQIEEALGPESTPLALPESPPPEPSPPPALPVPAMDMPSDAAAMRSAEWALLAKKIERRIKAGKDPVCAFESDVLSKDDVKSVMMRLTPQMTVHEAHDVVDEVKALDDMTEEERRIYDELISKFAERGAAWVRKILRNQDVNPTLRDIVAPVLNRELTRVAQAQIDTVGREIGVTATDATNDRVVDWLVDYVPMTTRQIDATTAERIKKVIDVYRQTPGMTAEDVAGMLRPSVDPARALMIARTEIVRSQTQANVIYKDYLAERGLNYERVWITERDDITCPICGPLDGKKEVDWGDIGGPPAHPNCRCATALRLVNPQQQQQQQQQSFAALSATEQAEVVRSNISEGLRTIAAEQQQGRRNLNNLLRQRNALTAGTPEYDAVTQQIQTEYSAFRQRETQINQQEAPLYRQLLQDLRRDNPQEVRITSMHSKLTPADMQRIEEFVRLSVGIADSDGKVWDIKIKPWKGAGMAADYDTIYVNPQNIDWTSALVHESMHILQLRTQYGKDATDRFVAERTQGEKLQPLAELEPTYAHGLKKSDKAYRDGVEDAYTLRKYKGSYEFLEVLPMGITDISGTATTSDPGLFEWWLQTVKDGGK
jgi:HK97 family phage portal protein